MISHKQLKTVLFKGFLASSCFAAMALMLLAIATIKSLHGFTEFPDNLATLTTTTKKPQLRDRHSKVLTITYQNHWNAHDVAPLHLIPEFLQNAFILAEDKRFYMHQGVDWSARLQALWQNVLALRSVRGASTISEQVVRMLHPRPRTLWSRWLEGWESYALENKYDKATILEFYLNQVPYAAQRRGVVQAARYYFDRDVSTLSDKEMLALAILVRAPSRLDLHKSTHNIENRLNHLLDRAVKSGLLNLAGKQAIDSEQLKVRKPGSLLDVQHFARYIYSQAQTDTSTIITTIDSNLQRTGQALLDQRLAALKSKQVHNAALLVLDHQNNEVLAWVNGKNGEEIPSYDAVLNKRQPGSALKPFVYAAALEKDWTAATILEDKPLEESVGQGVHTYRNYSNTYYGNVSVRQALGNSLNIPAIKTAQYVGLDSLLSTLRNVGIDDFNLRSVDYGNGIALGNGEVSLLSLAQAYAALARSGIYLPANTTLSNSEYGVSQSSAGIRALSSETSSLIGHILSDQEARSLEFGTHGPLSLPVQTAVKTGTSTEYRDAWVFGYNYRYVVAVWMGNLDNKPMDHITGSNGPALVLRAMFSELNRNEETQPLFFSRTLVAHDVCIGTGLLSDGDCATYKEWFLPDNIPAMTPEKATQTQYAISQPTDQLLLALDPRIADQDEAIKFKLNHSEHIERVEWLLNDTLVATSEKSEYLWPLSLGRHTLSARIYLADTSEPISSQTVSFTVK